MIKKGDVKDLVIKDIGYKDQAISETTDNTYSN